MNILTVILAAAVANAGIATLVYFSANYRRHIQHSWPGKYKATRYSLYFNLSWMAAAVAGILSMYLNYTS